MYFLCIMEKDKVLNILCNTIIKLLKNAISKILRMIQYCLNSRIAKLSEASTELEILKDGLPRLEKLIWRSHL